MKPALSKRVKNLVRRLLLSVAPLGSPRHTPQQLELFARSGLPEQAANACQTSTPSKPRSRNPSKGGKHLASFI